MQFDRVAGADPVGALRADDQQGVGRGSRARTGAHHQRVVPLQVGIETYSTPTEMLSVRRRSIPAPTWKPSASPLLRTGFGRIQTFDQSTDKALLVANRKSRSEINLEVSHPKIGLEAPADS